MKLRSVEILILERGAEQVLAVAASRDRVRALVIWGLCVPYKF